MAALVDLGHLLVAEIELISWVYIRPDQWDHIKALYHLIYCPRVNRKALIWPKIAFWEADSLYEVGNEFIS